SAEGHSWRLAVLVLSPGAILLFGAWLAENTPSLRGCLTAMALVFALVLTFWAYVGVAVRSGAEAITDPARYEKTMAATGYGEHEYLAHFPPEIPQDAQEVSFYCLQEPLLGPSVWELRMTLPPEQVEEIAETARDDMAEIPRDEVAAAHAGPSREELNDFPVVRGVVRGGRDRHGPVWGIAADPDSGEIIYWADHW
ncbi:MAG: hypothetical protein U9R79_07345, partial [Armatimonadota bacterium]|nr:hypothetical protein [Armatimonadota bacterium]